MLINLRNALMTGKRLPYDAEVEYLQSSGTQYIKSGLTVASGMRVVGDFDIQGVGWIFGGRSLSGSNQFNLYQYDTSAIRAAYGKSSVNISSVSLGRHTLDFDNNVFKIDGTIKQTFTAQTFSATSPLYIGTLSADNSGTAATSMFKGKIYSVQIYQNGVLVRDYIPVRKGTTGELYDRVSGKLFGNAGTGAFTYGNDLKYPIPA